MPRIDYDFKRSDSQPKVMNTGKGDGGLDDKMYRLNLLIE